MATTVKASFEKYRSNLEITDRQESLVAARRANVIAEIKKQLTLHPTEPSKVIGSWDRNTLTRYLFEGDVDVMVVMHYDVNKAWETSDGTVKCLDKFKAILDSAYPDTPKRRDQNCISMEFSEFSLDIVPAFRYKDGYYTIPDSIQKKWLETDPFEFAKKITAVNQTMGGSFVPLIKMVKGWNRAVGWPIKSFHLECMMYGRYSTYTQGYTYSSMMKVFFENLEGLLSSPCFDPVRFERVDGYLDNQAQKTKRQIALDKAKAAAEASADAYSFEESDPEKSIRKWKALLGEFFPAYG